MSFLDDLISEQKYSDNVDPGLFTYIESLIWNSSLDEKAKSRMMARMMQINSNEGAMLMAEELKESQPIIGLDRIPITQYEIVEATRNRVERENFKERGKERI